MIQQSISIIALTLTAMKILETPNKHDITSQQTILDHMRQSIQEWTK